MCTDFFFPVCHDDLELSIQAAYPCCILFKVCYSANIFGAKHFFFFYSDHGYYCFLSKTTVDIFVIQFHSINIGAVTKWILCIKRTSILIIVKSFYFTWLIFSAITKSRTSLAHYLSFYAVLSFSECKSSHSPYCVQNTSLALPCQWLYSILLLFA